MNAHPDGRVLSPCLLIDLMSWPFFSLAKSPRHVPVRFAMGRVTVQVSGRDDGPMATIWDADILIWAVSRLVAARRRGVPVSPRVHGSMGEVLRFIGRDPGAIRYDRLRASLDRLHETRVTTSLRQTREGAQGFSWLVAWQERRGELDLILPQWVCDAAGRRGVLTLDPRYFALTGGFERWLYLLVRRHAGQQSGGWAFDLPHLYRKSASRSPFPRFVFEIRRLVAADNLPGYRLRLEVDTSNMPVLRFSPDPGKESYPQASVDNHVEDS
ncbi:replication initiator protein A [Komagataeibacter oboediens]|uniref:replication initiator protein A n=1 Tax=Komagataeibacter oboediens TaxID=65958 RepID=UPI001C2BF930|nr:replication initiator protein A [Komagataeibacter oboediens]MBV0888823.1 replication initiator protein A [Komagataeibacter oboediens]MCK9821531.1 replication initiator protein A [Komagataeibacter oboediens]